MLFPYSVFVSQYHQNDAVCIVRQKINSLGRQTKKEAGPAAHETKERQGYGGYKGLASSLSTTSITLDQRECQKFKDPQAPKENKSRPAGDSLATTPVQPQAIHHQINSVYHDLITRSECPLSGTPSPLSVGLGSVLVVGISCRPRSTLRGASVAVVLETNHLSRTL